MAEMETTIGHLTKNLQDGEFYKRDPDGFLATSKELEKLKLALENAEHRWLELEQMRAAL